MALVAVWLGVLAQWGFVVFILFAIVFAAVAVTVVLIAMKKKVSIIDLLVFWTVVAMVASLLLPYHRDTGAVNLRRISMAMEEYHDNHGCYPPAWVPDEDGKPAHSWRVLILPYLGHGDLYNQYDFSEPWDGPNNRKLAGRMPEELATPRHLGRSRSVTGYVVVVGDKTVFPGCRSMCRDDITDGDDTILVVPCADLGIPWLEPRDLRFDKMTFRVNASSSSKPGIEGRRRSEAAVILVSGERHVLESDCDPELVKGMLTANGGEELPQQ